MTGGGGTNAACVAAQPTGEAWRCLMAEYLVPHVRTPLFVMNSAYDAYQLGNIGGSSCVPTAATPCDDAVALSYGAAFRRAAAAVAADGKNGVYVTACYVHEINVNYCSGQSMPNCVGWSPRESGSEKWHYDMRVGGRTPQQAFGDWYLRGGGARVSVDETALQHNAGCVFAPPKSRAEDERVARGERARGMIRVAEGWDLEHGGG